MGMVQKTLCPLLRLNALPKTISRPAFLHADVPFPRNGDKVTLFRIMFGHFIWELLTAAIICSPIDHSIILNHHTLEQGDEQSKL